MTEDVKGLTVFQLTEVLREWAEALRGDWGSIDGRGCRSELETLAALIDVAVEEPLKMTLAQVRDQVGICLHGGGHWISYCKDYDCSTYDYE